MRNKFLMNILLTLVWLALTGKFNFLNFLFGFLPQLFYSLGHCQGQPGKGLFLPYS
jgi:multisubunit Na+/H+ antiporter MnhE subunit